MADISRIAWRTCGACENQYQGHFGECPKCVKSSGKKGIHIGGSTGTKTTRPTLDTQEGTLDG